MANFFCNNLFTASSVYLREERGWNWGELASEVTGTVSSSSWSKLVWHAERNVDLVQIKTLNIPSLFVYANLQLWLQTRLAQTGSAGVIEQVSRAMDRTRWRGWTRRNKRRDRRSGDKRRSRSRWTLESVLRSVWGKQSGIPLSRRHCFTISLCF